ncbi:MAG TPA: hypothetical protein VN633_17005, partial [Bryobacteraceae bacterium]|nr:hypothetical protein [Bryobacteraceae bacterium]
KSCIASGYAFCGGLTVYEGLYYPDHGIVALPKKGEQPIGAHELFFYKYDDTVKCSDGSRGALWFRNSWGPKWAEGGDGAFPYSYFALPDVDWDADVAHYGPPWRP